VVTVRARRHVVAFWRSEMGLSHLRACALIGLHRSTSRYARRRDEDKSLRERLRIWAARRPRWGYRLLHWALTQEGCHVNRKKIYRLYREEGFAHSPPPSEARSDGTARSAGQAGANQRALVDGLHVG
jgi:putative transposase